MDRSDSTRSVALFVGALALVSVVTVLATGAFGRSVTPEPIPSEAPIGAPTPQPSVAPTPAPTVAPSPTPAGGLTFDLDVATPHDVSVVLEDEAIVENIDDDTIRLTPVGLPQDDIVEMVVKEVDGRIIVTIDQAAPPANSDAMGHDRVVEIDLSRAVDAEDVRVTVSN